MLKTTKRLLLSLLFVLGQPLAFSADKIYKMASFFPKSYALHKPVFPRNLLIELPGIAKDPEDVTRMIWNAMDYYLRSEYKSVVVLAAFTAAPAVIMTASKPVHKLADLRGLKLRIPSKTAARVVEAGGVPVQASYHKVYTAMRTGVVDGALMASDALLNFKLNETSNFVTVGLPVMVLELFIVMNEDAYAELSLSERQILDANTGLGLSLKAAAVLAAVGKQALEQFSASEGKELIKLSPEA